MKIKRRYSSLLYFNEKITVQNVVIETHREHAITITFCIQTCFRTKYYPPSPKKNCYTYLLTILTCVMLSTTVYRVYVYGINACFSTELNLGVAKTTYIIYSKAFQKKMLGLKCNCANVLAPPFALENIRRIFYVLKYVHRSTTLNKSSINPLLNLEISSPTQITLYL